jgi:hypothetical protein
MTIDAAIAMANAILSAVREWGSNAGVTFASLEKIPGFRGGGAVMTDPDNPNCIIWSDMSPQAAAAIVHLVNKNKIHFKKTSFESYSLGRDGSCGSRSRKRQRRPAQNVGDRPRSTPGRRSGSRRGEGDDGPTKTTSSTND